MSKKEKENHFIQTEGRINLTPSKYLSQVKLFLTLLCVGAIAISAAQIAFQGVTYLSLILTAVYAIICYLVVIYVYRHSQTASIKGDTLILNSMNKRSSVMSIRSVKKVKSQTFLGLKWTLLRYNLDGRIKTIYFVTRKIVADPEKAVKTALASTKKKKKANHKPGSVFAQQA